MYPSLGEYSRIIHVNSQVRLISLSHIMLTILGLVFTPKYWTCTFYLTHTINQTRYLKHLIFLSLLYAFLGLVAENTVPNASQDPLHFIY